MRSCARAFGGITAAAAAFTLVACSSSHANKPADAVVSGARSSAPGAAQSGGAGANGSPAAQSSARPVPHTTVAPPVPGSVKSLVPSAAVHTLHPVALNATADYRDGVRAAITVRAVHVAAHGPGEVAGPGLAATVTITNRSSRPVSVGNVVIDVETAAGTPGVPMTSGSDRRFSGRIPAGGHQTGVYQFTLPIADRNPVRVSVSYSPKAPVAFFVGNVD